MRLGILATHPIQYYAPLYRALAEVVDLSVFFAHRQTAEGQADAGFGVAFEWDVPLLEGYPYEFLPNQARRPGIGSFMGCDTPAIADRIASGSFDAFLVHGWNTKSYGQAITACWRTGTPVMVRGDSQLLTPRSRAKQAVKSVLYRAFIPRFDAYLVVGQRAAEYLRHYGASPDRMFSSPHFVDNAFFRSGAEASGGGQALRQELGVPDEAVLALLIGKLIDVKRPFALVEAVARAQATGDDLRAVVVGSGPLEGELRSAAAGLPIHFAGFKNQTELPAYYAAANVLAFPSAHETWGLVVNEAMACGTPAVVSSEVGCAPDLIGPDTGATFPVGDIEAFANSLLSVGGTASTDRVQRALTRVVDEHSVQSAVRGVLQAVQSVQRVSDPANRLHLPN